MNRTITINPDTQRIELMGRWTGFGFSPRNGSLWTPENHEFQPHNLAWLSLTVALGREWRELMADEHLHRHPPEQPGVIYLRSVLAGALERVQQTKRA